MSLLLGSVFAASVLGSAHCAGMCGGIAGVATAKAGPSGRVGVAHALYHLGRLSGYLALGGVAGTLGEGMNRAGRLGGVSQAAAWGSAVVMVIWGGWVLLTVMASPTAPRPALVRFRRSPGVVDVLQRTFSRALSWGRRFGPRTQALWLGLATAALPCGWLYSFVVVAAGTGSALGGAAVMAAFGLGSVPVLSGMGWIIRRLSARVQGRLRVASALLLVAFGLSNVWSRTTAVGAVGADVRGHQDMGSAKTSCH